MSQAAQIELSEFGRNERREKWARKMKANQYPALIRTQGFEVVIPIVQDKNGRYYQSLPGVMRKEGKVGSSFSLEALIQKTSALVMRTAQLAGVDPPFAVVDSPQRKERKKVSLTVEDFPEAVKVKLPEGHPFAQRVRSSMDDEKGAFWAAELAFARIDASAIKSKTSATLTYLAHLRLANDLRSLSYSCNKAHLQKRSGLGRTATALANIDLERIGLLGIEREAVAGTKGNERNSYTLFTTRTTPLPLFTWWTTPCPPSGQALVHHMNRTFSWLIT